MFKSLFAVALLAATCNVHAAFADAELDAMSELEAQWFDQADQYSQDSYGSSSGQSFDDFGSFFGKGNDSHDNSQEYGGNDRYGNSSGYSGHSQRKPSGYSGDSYGRSSGYQDPSSSIKRHDIQSGYGSSSIYGHNDQHRSSSPGYGQEERGYGQNSRSNNLDRYGRESDYSNKSQGQSQQIGSSHSQPHQQYQASRPSRSHSSGYDSLDSHDRQIARGPSYGQQNQGHYHGDNIFHSHGGYNQSHDHGHQHLQQYQGVGRHQKGYQHQPRVRQQRNDYWDDVQDIPRNSAGYDSYKRTAHVAPKKIEGYEYVDNVNFVSAQDYFTPVNIKNRTQKDKELRDEVEINRVWHEVDPTARRANIKAYNNGKDMYHEPPADSHDYESGKVGETKRYQPWTAREL